jgi:hypothetical protein
MNVNRFGYAYGTESGDKMNYAEFLELKRQRAKIENEQRLYPADSVFFSQNKATLKRIDERMGDLRESVPASYFSPGQGEVKKSITQDHPFIDSRLRSVEEMAKEIVDLDDAIKNCGPSQDRGAMIRNRAALNEALAVKAALLKAKRSDRGGRL